MAGIVHGGALTAAVATYGGRPEDWLDLSTGINPNMPELPAIPAQVWNRLPDQGLVTAARQAARDWYLGADVGQGEALPLPVPGTQAFIQLLPRLVPQERPVAILSPTYGEYAHRFRKAGITVDEIATLDAVRPEHGTLVVINPNNPDGRSFGRDQLLALYVRMQAQGGHLHVDEAFGDARPELSVAAEASSLPGLTVSRSFGKFFGLAGVRLGFVFARPELLGTMEAELGPWSVSGPALWIANELMRRERGPILERMRERKAALDAVLNRAGLAIAGGTELFALVRHAEAHRLFEHLAQAHILVRKFDYRPDWLRIGLAANGEGDRRLGEALAAFRQ